MLAQDQRAVTDAFEVRRSVKLQRVEAESQLYCGIVPRTWARVPVYRPSGGRNASRPSGGVCEDRDPPGFRRMVLSLCTSVLLLRPILLSSSFTPRGTRPPGGIRILPPRPRPVQRLFL